MNKLTLFLALAIILSTSAAHPANLAAQPPPVSLSTDAAGVRLALRLPGSGQTGGLAAATIGGYRLPAYLLALRVNHDGALTPQISNLRAAAYQGQLTRATPVIPQTASGQARPDLARQLVATLPTTPVTVLRDSRMRAARIAVLAISPLFDAGGGPQVASTLDVQIPNALPFSDDAATLLASSAPFLNAATPPPNSAATGQAWIVQVAQPGIQRLSSAALKSAGLDLATIDTSRLQLRRNGTELPLELIGSSEVRFYADTPGDRWNSSDRYWLTVGTSPGARMARRTTAPAGASERNTALERGTWQRNRVYDSQLPGPDGDHWFAADMLLAPIAPAGEAPTEPVTLTATLTKTLPLIAGTNVFTVTGSAYTGRPSNGRPPTDHTLRLQLGASRADQKWNGSGDWAFKFTLNGNQEALQLIGLAGDVPSGIEIDSVSYQRPVQLNVGQRGAAFAGVSGSWVYRLDAMPAGAALYDITSPAAPQRLTLAGSAPGRFQDGPAARRYLLAGPGTLHSPAVAARTPTSLHTPRGASVIYLAPQALHAALAPLITLRQRQGYTPLVIDLQAVYDHWSYGQVDPEAIRSFLRFVAASWQPTPTAVVLVGDGTSDPKDYSARGANNRNLLPPYLAMVDPSLGETACDLCYVQLDGPISADSPDLPDFMLGRLPVKHAAELALLVEKISSYEQGAGTTAWRSRALFLADNTYFDDGQIDPAGDFAAISDEGIKYLPAGMAVDRLYFDPKAQSGVSPPYHEPDAARAHQRVMASLQRGTGLMVFNGHGSVLQLAVTTLTSTPNYLLGLYDADTLVNGAYPLVLQFTCLTSAFQTPMLSGTSIDERLVLSSRGGAIGVWGSSGLGVTYGHAWLQQGLLQALKQNAPGTRRLGELVGAGLLELYVHQECCQDSLHTFVLLGDPLTRPLIGGAGALPRRLFVPSVQR